MITITLGWWLIPFAVTVISFCVVWSMNRGQSTGGFMDISAFFSFVAYVIFFVVPSLFAWLVWALLK